MYCDRKFYYKEVFALDFQRIDKNTVQCRMTEEEMNEYGFEIEDFFSPNQEKSREFLEQIVEKAEEEIGYEVQGGLVSMQLMRLPDNSISITFSDKGDDVLQNMIHHIQNLVDTIDESSADEIVNRLNKEMMSNNQYEQGEQNSMSENIEEFHKKFGISEEKKEEYKKHLKEIEKKKRDKIKKEAAGCKVYQFASLHNLEQFAESLSFDKTISSKLYKDNVSGKFYLLIKKGKLKLEQYQEICGRLIEYADRSLNQPYAEQYCKEHFECIIPKQALDILKEC